MCDRLSDLRDCMRRYAAGFDAAVLSVADVEQVVGLAAAVEGVASTLKALAAARVAEGGGWKLSGERSAAHHLARTHGDLGGPGGGGHRDGPARGGPAGGGGRGEGGSAVGLPGRRPGRCRGRRSSAQARLVEAAGKTSLRELRTECARTRAAAAPDPEARRRAIHRGRYLRAYTDAGGPGTCGCATTPRSGPPSWRR